MDDPSLEASFAVLENPPVYTSDVALDGLYKMVLRLTQELAISREQIALLQEALSQKDVVAKREYAALASSPDFAQEQLRQHGDLVATVIGDLPQQ